MSNYAAPNLETFRFRPGMHILVELSNLQFSSLKEDPDSTHQSLVILKSVVAEELDVNLAWGATSANLQAARYTASVELECRLDDPCATCMPTIVTGGSMLSPEYHGRLIKMPAVHQATHIQGTRWRMMNLATRMPFREHGPDFPREAMEVELSFIYAVSNEEYAEMRKQVAA